MEGDEKTTVSSCSDDLKGINTDDFQLIDTAFDLLDLERPVGPSLDPDDKDVDKSECLVTSTDDINPQPVRDAILEEPASLPDSQESPSKPEIDEAISPRKRKKTVSSGEDGVPMKKNEQPDSHKVNLSSDDVPIFDDTKLPKGWSRKVTQRKSGVSAGKYDVYVFSADGKKLRSRNELQAYLEENGITDILPSDIEFSVSGKTYKKSGKTPIKVEPSTGERKTAKRSRLAKSLSPKTKTLKAVTPKNKITLKQAATSIKRGRGRPPAVGTPAGKRLVVRLPISLKKKSPKVTSTPLSLGSSFRKSLTGRASTRNTPIQSSRRGRVIIPKIKESPESETRKPRVTKEEEKPAKQMLKRENRSMDKALANKKGTGRKSKMRNSESEDYETKTPGTGKRGRPRKPVASESESEDKPLKQETRGRPRKHAASESDNEYNPLKKETRGGSRKRGASESGNDDKSLKKETRGRPRKSLTSSKSPLSVTRKAILKRKQGKIGLKATKKAVKLAFKRVGRRPARYTESPDEIVKHRLSRNTESPDEDIKPSKKRGRSSGKSSDKSEVESDSENISESPSKEVKPTSSGRQSRPPARFTESPLAEKPAKPARSLEEKLAKKLTFDKKGKAGKKGKKSKTVPKMMTRGKRDALTKRNIEKEQKALEQDVELLKNAPTMDLPEESKEEEDNEFVTIKAKPQVESPLKETPVNLPHSETDESGHESIVIDKTEDTSPNPFKSRYLRKKGPNKALEALKTVPAGYHEAISQTVSKKKRRSKTPLKKSGSKTPTTVSKRPRSFSPVDLGFPPGLTMTSSGRTVRAPNRISPSPPPERRHKEESPKRAPAALNRDASPAPKKDKLKPVKKHPRKQKITKKSPKASKAKPVQLYDERNPPSDYDDRKEYPSRSSRNPYLDYIMSSDHARSPSPEDFLFDSLPNSDMRRADLEIRPDPRRKPAPVIKVPSKRKVDKTGNNRFSKSHFPASESDSDDLFDPHKENRFRKMHPELDDSIDDLDMIELQLQVTGGRHDDLSGKHSTVELLSKVESPISMELIDALRDHDYYFRPMRELHLPSSMMSEDSNSLPLS